MSAVNSSAITWAQINTANDALTPVSQAFKALPAKVPGPYDAAYAACNAATSALNSLMHGVTPPPPTKSYPTSASQVGPTNAAIIKPYTGPMTITTPNTVLANVAIKGQLTIAAANVQISNFTLDADGALYGVNCGYGVPSVVLNNGSITGATAGGLFGGNWTGNGLHLFGFATDASDGGANNTLNYCLVEQWGSNQGGHNDGFQSTQAQNLNFHNVNFNGMYSQTINGVKYLENSVLMLGPSQGPINNVIVGGCRIAGGNYSLMVAGVTNMSVVNCEFDLTCCRYGGISGRSSVTTWTGNVDQTGAVYNG